MKKKYLISFLYIIGIGIFLFLVWDFGFDNIIINIKKTGWWFLPIVGLWIFIYLFNALAWYVIIGNYAASVGFKKIYYATIGGFAINYITPFIMLGGEPYRIFILKKHMNTGHSIASVTLFALMHMLSHILLWLTAIPILLIFYYQKVFTFRWVFVFTFVILSLILYLFFARHKKGFFTPVINFLSKFHLITSLIPKYEKLEKAILDIDSRIRSFYITRKKDFFISLGFEFLSRLAASFEFWFALLAIGVNATLVDGFLINAGTSLMLNIVFFMPLELGAREGSIYLMFKILTVGSGQAIYISLVNRLRELFWIMIGLILIRKDMTGKDKVKSIITGNVGSSNINSSK